MTMRDRMEVSLIGAILIVGLPLLMLASRLAL